MKYFVHGLGLFAAMLVLAAGCSDDDKNTEPNPPATDHAAAFIVVSEDNSIAVLNVETDKVERTIPLNVGSWPHHLNLCPSGDTLMVGMPGMDLSGGHQGGMMGMHGNIVMMDPRTGQQIMSMQMEGMVHNAAVSPDGREIWTAMMMDSTTGMNAVHVYDRTMQHHMAEIRVGSVPQEVTFSGDGRYAFVCNGGSNTVSMMDTETKTVMETIHVGHWPVGAWPGVDGMMYVDNEDGNSCSVIDPDSMRVIATMDLGFMPGYVATPGMMAEIWITDPENAKVHYYDRSTREHLGSFAVGMGAHAIAFTAGGEKAYVTNEIDGTVSVVDVAGHVTVKTVAVGGKPNGVVVRTPRTE
jgi:YVTN family beta-propeller protein